MTLELSSKSIEMAGRQAPRYSAPPRQQPTVTSERPSAPSLRYPSSGMVQLPHRLGKLLAIPLLAFLALPLLALFVRIPPGHLLPHLSDPQVVQAVSMSLSSTLATTLVTIGLGTPVGYLLARHRFPLRRAVDTLVDLPTVLPPAVAGVALLLAFGRRGMLGGVLQWMNIDLAFTWFAVVMAQTFVAAPFYVKAAALGFASIEPELEQAAALDGASSWQVFRHVTLRLAWTGLLGGCVMTWARALSEFGATMIFAGNYPGRTQTMPLAIYLGFELDLYVALTLAVIQVSVSFLILFVVKSLLHREVNPGAR